MTEPSPYEIASAVAAIVSAIGGAFAALAAFRSAAFAKEATLQAEESERRALIREVSKTAAEIMASSLSTSSRGQDLIVEYRTAEVFSGSAENSSIRQLQENTASLVERSRSFAEDAKTFVGGAKALALAPHDEIDRVRTRLTENLGLLRVIREELDRKYADMTARNLQHRQAAIQRGQR